MYSTSNARISTYMNVTELDRVHERIAGRLARSEPRARAREYVSGPGARRQRKNSRTLAEQALPMLLSNLEPKKLRYIAFGRVGDRCGPCRHICADPVLEVEGEVGMGEKVRVPAGRGPAGAAAQVGGARSSVEEDLDAAWPAGAASQRRDVDDAVSGARGGG
ncbi:hypothetical protein GCM10017567_19690 [Amycolatopsis bullii]|uniref:Uncharacterized protein n=1 Tax=Amycolatopsis bullii TaxID=941987 RepID=A0ABQ3K5H9_9PSEU|nr:hypothetical protein GCM10017567_19690 [Amycolatopsis bullii]